MKKVCLFIISMFLSLPVCFAQTTTNAIEKSSVSTTTNTQKEEKCIGDTTNCVNQDNESQKSDEDDLLDDGKSAILIESTTGKVIYEKNSHERYAPASMTKIMSMILIIEEIEKGNLKWNDKLVTSEYASSMGGSQIFLQPNEKMSVKDLFKAVAIGSANDATVVFAEKIAGTEAKFVKKMNDKAKELGLKILILKTQLD